MARAPLSSPHTTPAHPPQVKLPAVLAAFLATLDLLNWDLLRLVPGWGCLVEHSHHTRLLVATLLPIALSVPLLLASHFGSRKASAAVAASGSVSVLQRSASARRASVAATRSFRAWAVQGAFPAWLALTFFIYVRRESCAFALAT